MRLRRNNTYTCTVIARKEAIFHNEVSHRHSCEGRNLNHQEKKHDYQIPAFAGMTIFLLFTFLLFSTNLQAQKPYFQQEVNYTIHVKLDDVKNTLVATETILYKNNSPDLLKELWFHIWPNAYSDRTTALAKQKLENGSSKLYFATDDEKGFIDSLNFVVDGKAVKYELHPQYVDVCKLILNEPVKAGASITISTPFHVKIPSAAFSRLGHTGQAYYISQWFPKPAVYDNKGWHEMPFLNQGEFYSEYGSWDVSITLPKNYVVGATGDLVDGENELQWLNKKVEETKAITAFNTDLSFPKSDTEFKTLNYHQTNVHDFAWFADKRYHVLKGEVELPHTKNKVTTWTFFTNSEAKLWMNSIEYLNDALHYYSLWNGDYPYKQCTVVDGTITAGGGMEYPNIAIVGECGNAFNLEDVIVHEVGHNWFYGLLGSNERDHAWMDEGINSFNELRYMMTKYPPEKFGNKTDLGGYGTIGRILGSKHINFHQSWDMEYQIGAAINNDQPIEITSAAFTPLNYGSIVYRKTALVFDYLKSYLGDSLFDKCMQRYFDEWHYRHPYPEDIRKIFEETTHKNLSWFFDDLILTTKKIDYGICNEKKSGTDYILTLANHGEVKSPIVVSAMKGDSILNSTWIEGFDKQQEVTLPCIGCDHFRIDANYTMPEVKRKNNFIRASGLFKKVEPLSLNFLGHFEYPQRTRINFMPVVAWNQYNSLMLGVAVYNKFIPEKKFEYVFTPMYGFGDKDIAGIGNLSYSLFPRNGLFDRVTLSGNTRRFAYLKQEFRNAELNTENTSLHYIRLNPELQLMFRKNTARSSIRNSVSLSAVYINEQYVTYTNIIIVNDSTNYHYGNLSTINRSTFRAAYQLNNARNLDPFSILVSAEGNADYLKAMLKAEYKISYPKSTKGLVLHLFAGGFGFDNTNFSYPFYLSNWSGSQDAWYDDFYFGRSESEHLLSQQMSQHDGGFKVNVPYAKSNKWMAAFNINAAVPHLPLSVFADIGSFENAKKLTRLITDDKVTNSVLYDAGICLDLTALKIYLPLFRSPDITDYQSGTHGLKKISVGEQIRFEFNINMLNPFNFRKQFYN